MKIEVWKDRNKKTVMTTDKHIDRLADRKTNR